MRALGLIAAAVLALEADAQSCALPAMEIGGGAVRIGLMGDSITYGGLVATSPAVRIQAWYPTAIVSNLGVNGDTTSGMSTRFTSTVLPGHFAFLWVLGGVNDLITTTDSSATIFGRLQAIYDAALAASIVIAPITITPFGNNVNWSSARETKRAAINVSILAYCAAHSINCVDASAALANGGDATKLSAAYDVGDGLHPNQAGSDLLVSLAEPYLH